MNIEKLTKILGKELAAECENDAPQQEGEFTIVEMMEATGWSYAKARRKVGEMIKAEQITKRGKKVIFYLAK